MVDMVVEREKSSSAGPIVAVVAIVILAFFAYLAWQYFGGTTPSTTNVNVTTPTVPANNGQ